MTSWRSGSSLEWSRAAPCRVCDIDFYRVREIFELMPNLCNLRLDPFSTARPIPPMRRFWVLGKTGSRRSHWRPILAGERGGEGLVLAIGKNSRTKGLETVDPYCEPGAIQSLYFQQYGNQPPSVPHCSACVHVATRSPIMILVFQHSASLMRLRPVLHRYRATTILVTRPCESSGVSFSPYPLADKSDRSVPARNPKSGF
jgi:hypothetical protein